MEIRHQDNGGGASNFLSKTGGEEESWPRHTLLRRESVGGLRFPWQARGGRCKFREGRGREKLWHCKIQRKKRRREKAKTELWPRFELGTTQNTNIWIGGTMDGEGSLLPSF